MKKLTIKFLGAAGTVTGSKYLVNYGGTKIMVDCGMFQGLKKLRLLNWDFPLPDTSDIKAVLLTHAHLDHTGFLPKLVKTGFNGPIYGTIPTLDIAEIILKDSAKIQEEEAERANRFGYSKHKPAKPFYDLHDVEQTIRRFTPVSLNEWHTLTPEIKFRHRYVGHIIGATFIELEIENRRIVFSGDVGRTEDSLLRSPDRPERADVLLIESTYGDRVHPKEDVESKLAAIVNQTAQRGGTLIIPSFAVERIQSMMLTLWKMRSKNLIPNIPVYMDSPMGKSVLEVFHKHREWHKLSPEDCTKMCSEITRVVSIQETQAIVEDTRPKIVIAGSGMITGGRVLTYLQKYIGDKNSTVLLIGYQAEGTRGRQLLEGQKEIKIYKDSYPVKASVETIQGLSAHADSAELLSWMKGIKEPPKQIFIVHGEKSAAQKFQGRITAELGWDSYIPQLFEEKEIQFERETVHGA